jgi:hypothetical protein
MTVPKTSDMRDVSKMCVMNASLSVQEGWVAGKVEG